MSKKSENHRVIPPAVQNALQALELLHTENPGLATHIEKELLSHAVRLGARSEDISVERLLGDARKGQSFLQKNISERPQEKVLRPKTYAGVVAKLKPLPESRNFELALVQAIKLGQLEQVKELVRKGADVKGDNTAIAFAAIYGELDIFKYLHQAGADISVDKGERMADAALYGYIDIVRYLHQQGVDIKSNPHIFPMAAQSGDVEIVQYIEQNGADIFTEDNEAIIRAAVGGHFEVVKYLHLKGADIRAQQDKVLLGAIKNGDKKTIDYFLQYVDRGTLSDEAKEKLDYCQQRFALWQTLAHIDPPIGLHGQNPKLFDGELFKSIATLEEAEERDQVSAWFNYWYFQAAAVFPSDQEALKYLERWGNIDRLPLFSVLLRTVELPQDQNAEFNRKDWSDAIIQCGPKMAKLLKYADRLPSPVKSKDGKNWSIKRTRAAVANFAFKGAAAHPELAALCLQYGRDEEVFNKAAALIQEGAPEKKTIPNLNIKGEKFGMPGARLYRLASDDVRALFLGEMINNCQSMGSNGERFVEHGCLSENSGFYIIEDAKGKIIGETWAWRGTKGELCFDSIETLGDEIKPEQWTRILKSVGQSLARRKKNDVTQLTVGLGGATPGVLQKEFERATTPAVLATEKDMWMNDSKKQIVVWTKPDI